jgi:hypothetical protein
LFSSFIFVVCTLNRLAIKTAKSLGLEAFFVDSLAWMWKEIPEEYLMADTYYCFDLFDIKSKLPPRNNIKVISPIFGNLPKTRATKDSFFLFHIGGFKNPFQDKLSFAYLNLLVEAFNLFDSSAPVVITGGKDAVSYMKGMLDRQNYDFCTLGRNDFLEQLSRTSHFITTSGLTATLEAFALQAPTSFIPPTNLSQWKILKLMSKQGCADSRVEWKDVLGDEIDLTDFSEKDAMPHFHKMAEETYKEAGYRGRFVNGVKAIMSKVPDITSLSQLINRAGTNGSQIIIDDLMVKLE